MLQTNTILILIARLLVLCIILTLVLTLVLTLCGSSKHAGQGREIRWITSVLATHHTTEGGPENSHQLWIRRESLRPTSYSSSSPSHLRHHGVVQEVAQVCLSVGEALRHALHHWIRC